MSIIFVFDSIIEKSPFHEFNFPIANYVRIYIAKCTYFIAKMPVLDLICGQTFHNWKIIFHQSLQHFLKQWTLKNDRSHFGRAGGDASKCVSSCVHCVRSFISIGLWRPQPIFVSSYLYLDFLVNFRRSSLKAVWRKNAASVLPTLK